MHPTFTKANLLKPLCLISDIFRKEMSKEIIKISFRHLLEPLATRNGQLTIILRLYPTFISAEFHSKFVKVLTELTLLATEEAKETLKYPLENLLNL